MPNRIYLGHRIMNDMSVSSHVLPYYPDARKASVLVEAFLWYTKRTIGVGEERIALLSSVCSDDLNSVELPDTDMVGPFLLGGLDGYPFVGKTGLGAFSHHVPEHGAALLFFGPHVGITDAGQVGRVVRPGQSAPSDCCGAAMAGLRKLEAGGITYKPPCDFAVDDYQQEMLEQLLLKSADEILGVGSPDEAWRFVRLTEVIYRETKQTLLNLLNGVPFEAPAFVFGGILINEDGGRGSSIAIRDVIGVQGGNFVNMTNEFAERSGEKFKDLEAGKVDVFR
jgi:Limiting CO2-inducible proteins B/C beta carbonyic anhydrases